MNETNNWDEAYSLGRNGVAGLSSMSLPQDDASDGSVLSEIPLGAVDGAVNFGKSIGGLADKITEAFGGDLFSDEDLKPWRHTKTWVGGLTSGLTEFTLGFIPVAGIAGKLSTLAKAGTFGAYAADFAGSGLGKLALNVGKAGVTDFISFDGQGERLANIVQRYPNLANPVTDFLSAKGDDGWALGRVKNVLEGIGVSAIVHPFISALKGFKGMAAAKAVGNEAEFKAIAQQTQEEVSAAVETSSQGEKYTLYRGGNPQSPMGGSFHSEDPAVAAQYGEVTKQEVAFQNPLKAANWMEAKSRLGLPRDSTMEQLIQESKKAGYDGLIFENHNGKREFVVNQVETASEKAPKDAIPDVTLGEPSQALPGSGSDDALHSPSGPVVKMRDDASKIINDAVVSGATHDTAVRAAADQTLQTWINYAKLKQVPLNAQEMLENMQAASEDTLLKDFAKLTPLKQTLSNATKLSELLNQSPATLRAQLAAAPEAMLGLDSRLVSYKQLRNSAAQHAANLVTQIGNAADEAAKAPLQGELDSVLKVFLDLHYNTQLIQTEAARATSAGRIATNVLESADIEELTSYVKDTLAGPDGHKLAAALESTAGDGQAMANVLSAAKQGVFAKAGNTFMEYWVNALLSSPVSWATKLVSDSIQTVVKPFERMIGGAIRGDIGAVKNAANIYGNLVGLAADTFNIIDAASKAPISPLKNAAKVLVGASPILDNVGSIEGRQAAISAANYGLNPGSLFGTALNWMGSLVRTPQRIFASIDETYKGFTYTATAKANALTEALEKGITEPGELEAFVRGKLQNAFSPTGAALDPDALRYSRDVTSTSDLLPGTFGKTVMDVVNKHPTLRLFVPFLRTPLNLFRKAVQYTPGLQFLDKEFRQAYFSPDRFLRADATGRQAVGAMFWLVAGGAALNGRLTGSGPSARAERAALLASGWQPYSLKVDNADGSTEYISYRRLEPIAALLGMAADYAEASGHASDDDLGVIGKAMLQSVAHNLTDKTYMTGLSDLVNLISHPDENAKSYISNLLGSTIPNGLSKFNDDPYLRETRSILDALRARIPGLSDSLPPRRNALGEPINVPSGWAPFGTAGTDPARWLSPFAYSKAVDDPAKQELAKLRFSFGLPSSKYQGVKLSDFKGDNGQDGYDRLQELAGQVKLGGRSLGESLNKLVTSQDYQKYDLPTDEKDTSNGRIRAVLGTIANYRSAALEKLLKEMPEIRGQVIANQKAKTRKLSPTLALFQ